jgi:SAM-dependent methyltransferase
VDERMVIPDGAVKFILFQRTGYLRFPKTLLYRALDRALPFSIYNPVVEIESRLGRGRVKALYSDTMAAEYESIRGALPEACSAVLDIGCGVAGLDVFLERHYRGRGVHFYLLDKTRTEKSVYYDMASKGAFYNSLGVAEDLLASNGVTRGRIHLLEANEANEVRVDRKIDLVVSLISWGFHYPVATYAKQVREALSDQGVAILDARKGEGGVDELRRHFGSVEVIKSEPKYERVAARP